MGLLILDTNLNAIATWDTYKSIIWTERHNKCGDFEIYTNVTAIALECLQPDNFIYRSDSDRVMVIEDREIKYDVEDGYMLIVKGRSFESVLDRRIIWSQISLTGNLQNGIETLLNQNVISPSLPDRNIPYITFEASTDPVITALTVDAQYTRENLYEVITKLCATNNIGFKVTINDDLNGFVFKLYAGTDRSYSQVTNPYIVFSRQFDNLISSDYKETYSKYKTVSVVKGEDDTIKIVGTASEFARREMYTESTDVSREVNGVAISVEEYNKQLEQRALEILTDNSFELSLDADIDTSTMFKYDSDFFLGDFVQISSDFGISGKAQITEIIRSHDENGTKIYPKFEITV